MPGIDVGDAEVDELADAVFDVEPQPAERLHQRFDVEALVGPRAQIPQDAGAQRRLHERAEPRLEVRRLGRFGRGCGARAPRAEGQVVHCGVLVYRLLSGRADRADGAVAAAR